MLRLDETLNSLFDPAARRRFDPVGRTWAPAPEIPAGNDVSTVAAATWLQRRSGHPLRQPVAVIGPRDANADEMTTAEALGHALASIGFTVVCGGKQGIMQAVCRGVAAAGGMSIGLLPETEVDQANPYVTIPIATGIGEARNVLVARAGFCLVCIGNSYGTLSEVALGLQFGRPVIGLCGAPQVEGVRHLVEEETAVDAVAAIALGLDAIS
jgi:uncharacterized protein (TIGR00725 family)